MSTPSTPGTRPNKESMEMMINVPQPLSKTAKGGHSSTNKTLKQDRVVATKEFRNAFYGLSIVAIFLL